MEPPRREPLQAPDPVGDEPLDGRAVQPFGSDDIDDVSIEGTFAAASSSWSRAPTTTTRL